MNASRQGSGQLGDVERAILIVAAITMLVGAGVWAWAGLAGVLFGGGWPHLTPTELSQAMVSVPAHLSDPRRAFPRTIRSQLPGTAGFYVALVVLLAVAGVAAWLAVRVWQQHRSPNRGKRTGARWARGGDLGRLQRGRPARSERWSGAAVLGLSLGYQRGSRPLRAEDRHALVVFGPTQSGKSAGIAIPNILEWAGPAIVVSIKPDLLDATMAARADRGDVLVYDPFDLWGGRSHTWSPLASSATWNAALETAQRMAAAGQTDTSSVKGGSFWSQAAEQRMAPLLYVARRSGRTMADVVSWVYGAGGADLDRLMHELVDHSRDPLERADAQHALDAHLAFAALAGETKGAIEGTAQILMSAYRSPTVVRSANGADITGDRLLAGANTVYLISDARRSKLLRPILIALLSELLDQAYETANSSPGRRLPQPLLVCLDELGNAVPLPNLAELASTAASHNIQLISIFHDVAQARERYGQQALTVINNHRARMLMSGVADMETLRYFSELVGDEEVKDRSERDAPIRRRPLAPADELRQIKPEHSLLIYGALRPATLKLRLYFKDRRLRGLAAGQQTEAA
jgi:type IV secretory pathway TraG/TraD family ATPase VirD4